MSTSGPVQGQERNMMGQDFFLLWAGGLLVFFGLLAGLFVIVAGHAAGNTPMALGADWQPPRRAGRGALGNRGPALPDILNAERSGQRIFPHCGKQFSTVWKTVARGRMADFFKVRPRLDSCRGSVNP